MRLRDKRAWMKRTLRRLALECDPEQARMTKLAEHCGVEYRSVLRWVERGHVPVTRANWLEREFGRTLAPADKLALKAKP